MSEQGLTSPHYRAHNWTLSSFQPSTKHWSLSELRCQAKTQDQARHQDERRLDELEELGRWESGGGLNGGFHRTFCGSFNGQKPSPGKQFVERKA